MPNAATKEQHVVAAAEWAAERLARKEGAFVSVAAAYEDYDVYAMAKGLPPAVRGPWNTPVLAAAKAVAASPWPQTKTVEGPCRNGKRSGGVMCIRNLSFKEQAK